VDECAADTGIALDSMDKVHISYETSAGLTYATNASGEWVIEHVDPVAIDFTSIALDNLDRVHITYADATNYDLKYATDATDEWVITTVQSAVANNDTHCRIAIDSLDKAHISYFSGIGVLYATNVTGSWENRLVDLGGPNGHLGGYTSIALDSSDHVHISYGLVDDDASVSDLRHLTNASGSWVTEPVKWPFEYPMYRGVRGTAIAIDGSDNVHIGFLEGNTMNYATTGLCFVATAAFGTELDERMDVLRSFRDMYLIKCPVGRNFLALYYKYSPLIADYIAERDWLRALVRTVLLPVIGFVSLFV
jgi:hypothetical protein